MKLLAAIGFLLCYALGYGQCTNLSLSVDRTLSCAPSKLQYIVHNVPSGSAISWDFGSGYASGTDTVYKFYVSPQKIDVRVSILMPDKTTCQLVAKNIAEIKSIPVPEFIVSRDRLCFGPDTVTLTNITPGAALLNWVIDGTNYYNAGNSVSHKFKTSGPKKISLFVIDSLGCKGVSEKENLVNVYSEVSLKILADDTVGCVPKSVQFLPDINANGEQIISYQWSFPGQSKNSDNKETPDIKTYYTPGSFNAGLKVLTANGCLHSVLQKNILNFGDSVTLDLVIGERSICRKQEISILETNQLPGKYSWVIPGASEIRTISSNEIRVRFDTIGTYDLLVTYVNNKCYTEKFIPKAFKVKSVTADFISTDNFHCKIPHTVHFENLSKSSESGTFDYTWKYYDMSIKLVQTSNRINDSIYFDNWGTFNVELIAKHSSGCADTLLKHSFINLDSMRADFYSWPSVFCVGEEVIFHNITKKSSFISKDTLYWVYMDKDGKRIKDVSNDITGYQTYYDTGFYDVILFIGNKIGCSDSVLKKNIVEIVDPVLRFKVSDTIICQNSSINFLGQSLPSKAEFSYNWDITHSKGLEKYEKDDSTTFNIEFSEPGYYDLKYEHDIHGRCEDSVTIVNYLAINGVKAGILLDSSNGCLPFRIKAKPNIEYDYHAGFDSTFYQYYWYITGGKGFVISKNSSSEIEVIFTEKGTFQIHLDITNSAGCTYSAVSDEINAGVLAAFELQDNRICTGASVLVKNQSSFKPSKYDWQTTAGFATEISFIEQDAVLKFKKAGNFEIELVASKYGQCFDTVRQKIEVIEVVSRPVPQDSMLSCAPAYAQFLSKSINADTLIWDFGEGTIVKTTDSFVANIYLQNSGWKNGFDITLVANSNEGCSDTVILPGSVKVLGPVPMFRLKNNKGCEPLMVEFINESQDVQSYFMNFNDGSSLDTAVGLFHKYIVTNYTGIQTFLPTVFVKDSLGCAAIFTSLDTITVKRKPSVDSKLDAVIGCAPFTTVFNGFGADLVSQKWLLNGQEIGTKTFGSSYLPVPGLYNLIFVAFNGFGCSDSSFSDIKVKSRPEANIITTTESCLGETNTYKASVTSDTGIASFNWISKDDAETNYSQGDQWDLTFKLPGRKYLTLMVEDRIGCRDSFTLSIDISDPLKIPKPQISYVTVIDNSTVKVVFENLNYPRFARMNLYKAGVTTPVYSSANMSDTVYFETFKGNQQAYCYYMNIQDLCGFNGGEGREHCQVILNADNSEPFKIKLNWSGYKGWDNAHTYELFRRKGLGKYVKIADLPAHQTAYTDSPLCDFYYEYYIEAINPVKMVRSQSNSIQLPVFYKLNKQPANIENVSVEGNNVVVKLKRSVNENFSKFKLFKYRNGAYGNEIYSLTNDVFIDKDVNVNAESYIYTIREVDLCGYETPIGRQGTSLLLDGIYSNDQSFLSWNGYLQWESGVKEYQLQIEKPSGFVTLNTANMLDTGFIDKEIHYDIKGKYCYRVTAISGNSADTSYSNKICLAGSSKVFIPNAFTPNGNLLNEVFRPVTLFVTANPDVDFRDFDFKIYNRWGELLFATNDMEQGWNGTYNGHPVADGTYLFTIRASGIDNRTYKLDGPVHLIR
jgi:gliding motility-associated-like protein